MNTPEADPRPDAARARAHERDQPPSENDSYARTSFTWRRMETWQIWALLIAAIIIVILGIAWVA